MHTLADEQVESILSPKARWRTAHADRVAFLVNGAAYFGTLADALQRARRSILVVGWDIHSRACLRPDAEDGCDRCHLVDVLNDITARHRALRINILTWDPAPVFTLEREFLPLYTIGWHTGPRVDFRLASDHPAGASHHQKIVVIDDRVAFLGGLDLTIARWDTGEHRVDNPHRALPGGKTYGPYHDVQMAVDGEAAAALGELVRERWRRATGERLRRPRASRSDPWPPDLAPDMEDVAVTLARTQAPWDPEPAVREVEALFVESIAAARHSLYFENQYLTSDLVARALCARLREPDGPEVVIVTSRGYGGPLEEMSMGALRARVVHRLRTADAHGRLRVMWPSVGGDANVPVTVHAKVSFVDDRLVHVGSANLSNRSMGLDTECDAAIESGGDPVIAGRIRAFRDSLLAEHLGCDAADVARAIDAEGSLRAAIDRLRDGDRTLHDLDHNGHEGLDELVPYAELVDASRPVDETLVHTAMPDDAIEQGSRHLPRIVLMLLVALALVALWTWTPLRRYFEVETLLALAAPLRHHWLGAVAWTILCALGTLVMVPIVVLIATSVFLFGTWFGFSTAFVGAMIGAAAGFLIGRLLWRRTLRRLSRQRLDRLMRRLGRGGILAVIVIRNVPVAPYLVVNLVAGSSGLRLRDYMIGTAIGMAPGMAAIALAADRVVAAARNPEPATIALAVVVIAVAVAAIYAIGRLLERARRHRREHISHAGA